MARRNIFQPPPVPSAAPEPEDTRARFPNTGAMSGVKSTLKDVASNAVRDIAIEMIEDSGPKDRLAFDSDAIASLAESIRAHGQQVPIMVRPIASKPGHYRIVYGRRRLAALRLLGLPAKALVRSLTDAQAILAQGQENSQRLDPSFIEKALFVAELAAEGYEPAVILDALAVDKPMLSRMTKVARAVPRAVIEAIGAAHGVGRRRWEDFADQLRDNDLDLGPIMARLPLDEAESSDTRFGLVSDAVTKALRSPALPSLPAQTITLADGTPIAEIKETGRALSFKISKTNTPEFADWLQQNAESELRRLFLAAQTATKAD